MKTGILVVVLAVILLSNTAMLGSSYGATEGEDVRISGYLNVREIVYLDGTFSYDYLVMNDETASQARYLLEFDNEEEQGLMSNLVNLAGSRVLVEGLVRHGGEGEVSAASSDIGQSGNAKPEEKIRVKSIEISGESDSGGNDGDRTEIGSSVYTQLASLMRTLEQVVVPARYADIEARPHAEGYYSGQFYADANYSLAAYWRDASYGKFAIEGRVAHWVDLPKSEGYYLEFGGREADLIAAVDSQIDFDGPDNLIENVAPNDFLGPAGGDDVDSVVGIYNGLIGPGIAGYGYVEPIQLSTQEGTL
ncbi:MAG: hypothetical protein ACREA4_06705, partial [Nitrososphaera sp.]